MRTLSLSGPVASVLSNACFFLFSGKTFFSGGESSLKDPPLVRGDTPPDNPLSSDLSQLEGYPKSTFPPRAARVPQPRHLHTPPTDLQTEHPLLTSFPRRPCGASTPTSSSLHPVSPVPNRFTTLAALYPQPTFLHRRRCGASIPTSSSPRSTRPRGRSSSSARAAAPYRILQYANTSIHQ